ncbi:MAG: TatD family hydrolase, partial [Plesiomonas shigelloides]
GECGLDFNRDFSPRPQQLAAFAAQLALAAEVQLPVFLHCRDAFEPFFALLREHRAQLCGGVLHCFTGSDQDLDSALELGLSIGVTGWLCDERRGELLRQQVQRIPAERLLLETDAPYLLPRDLQPKPKSRRNEPGILPHIVSTVAALRGECPHALARQTTRNAATLFRLPLTA